MTEEQIKQNANDYTDDHGWIWDDSGESHVDISTEILDAYLTGAHSRDEEVNHWKESYEELAEITNELQTERQTLMIENAKLRNPWISVEKRLPERESEKASWSVYVFIRTCYNSHEEAKYDTVNGIWYDKHKQVINDPITHWMPIPIPESKLED